MVDLLCHTTVGGPRTLAASGCTTARRRPAPRPGSAPCSCRGPGPASAARRGWCELRAAAGRGVRGRGASGHPAGVRAARGGQPRAHLRAGGGRGGLRPGQASRHPAGVTDAANSKLYHDYLSIKI